MSTLTAVQFRQIQRQEPKISQARSEVAQPTQTSIASVDSAQLSQRCVADRGAFEGYVDRVKAFRGEGSQPVGATAQVSQSSSAPRSQAESYRELIDKDIETAYGRKATEKDYEYWMPKLQGPCDSSFVTGGQMSGTEYWHRRMLGWQAGGEDLAKSGPYAGSPNAQGPVPKATEVVSDVSAGGAYDQASPKMLQSFRSLVKSDMQTAYGREATEEDYAYWLNKLLGPNDSSTVTSGEMSATEYWHRRMLGWQAGGADMAKLGPYAGSSEARTAVPAATAVVANVPSRGVF